MRQMLQFAKAGYSPGVTVDGPKGPKYLVKPGVVFIARQMGLPILPVTFASSANWIADNWDRTILPKPFSRMRIVVGAPIDVPRRMDAVATEHKRREVEIALRAITDDADEIMTARDRAFVNSVRTERTGRAEKKRQKKLRARGG
jgi:lysophospholipid acyltransferase (LPLAT)-like uncharacterized protein